MPASGPLFGILMGDDVEKRRAFIGICAVQIWIFSKSADGRKNRFCLEKGKLSQYTRGCLKIEKSMSIWHGCSDFDIGMVLAAAPGQERTFNRPGDTKARCFVKLTKYKSRGPLSIGQALLCDSLLDKAEWECRVAIGFNPFITPLRQAW
jgi:hypothetical protein